MPKFNPEIVIQLHKEHMNNKVEDYKKAIGEVKVSLEVEGALAHIEESSKDHTVGTKESLIKAQQTLENYIASLKLDTALQLNVTDTVSNNVIITGDNSTLADSVNTN